MSLICTTLTQKRPLLITFPSLLSNLSSGYQNYEALVMSRGYEGSFEISHNFPSTYVFDIHIHRHYEQDRSFVMNYKCQRVIIIS